MTIKPVNLEQFNKQVGNIYEAIIVAAKRARQLHEDTRIELNQRLETIKQLTATPESEEDETNAPINPDQLKISLEFEKRQKATEVALNEMQAGRIEYRYKTDDEQ